MSFAWCEKPEGIYPAFVRRKGEEAETLRLLLKKYQDPGSHQEEKSEDYSEWLSSFIDKWISTSQFGEYQKTCPSFRRTRQALPFFYWHESTQEKIARLYDLGTEDFIAAYITNRKQGSLLESIATRTQELLEESRAQRKEHAAILEKCLHLEVLLERQTKNNERLRRLLNRAYPVERLSIIAGALFVTAAASLLGTAVFEVDVLHPALSAIALITSVSFLILARWRKVHA